MELGQEPIFIEEFCELMMNQFFETMDLESAASKPPCEAAQNSLNYFRVKIKADVLKRK